MEKSKGLGDTVAKITKFKDHIDVFINDKNGEHKISAEALLIAAGVTPNIENLGLEKANIKLENNQIKLSSFIFMENYTIKKIKYIIIVKL